MKRMPEWWKVLKKSMKKEASKGAEKPQKSRLIVFRKY